MTPGCGWYLRFQKCQTAVITTRRLSQHPSWEMTFHSPHVRPRQEVSRELSNGPSSDSASWGSFLQESLRHPVVSYFYFKTLSPACLLRPLATLAQISRQTTQTTALSQTPTGSQRFSPTNQGYSPFCPCLLASFPKRFAAKKAGQLFAVKNRNFRANQWRKRDSRWFLVGGMKSIRTKAEEPSRSLRVFPDGEKRRSLPLFFLCRRAQLR